MAFVFSPWYFVMIALVVGIIACLVVFFRMDKKDKEIIKDFLEESQKQVEEEPSKESSDSQEKPKVKKCKYCEATNDIDAKKCSSCGADLYAE